MEPLWGCLVIVLVIAPLAVIVLAFIEIHRLKSAVRNLVSRVSQLEGSDRGMPAPRPAPAAEEPASPRPAARPAATPLSEVKNPPAPITPAGAPPPPPTHVPAPPPLHAPPPPPPPEHRRPAAPPPPPVPPPIPSKPFDWEAFFGVKLFAWIGGFVLFLGIVFLVKYSFENNLITPAMRIAIGTV